MQGDRGDPRGAGGTGPAGRPDLCGGSRDRLQPGRGPAAARRACDGVAAFRRMHVGGRRDRTLRFSSGRMSSAETGVLGLVVSRPARHPAFSRMAFPHWPGWLTAAAEYFSECEVSEGCTCSGNTVQPWLVKEYVCDIWMPQEEKLKIIWDHRDLFDIGNPGLLLRMHE